jgi:hypothetical protein
MEVKISADIYCDYADAAPAYRIYVDRDLITERTFRFPPAEIYLQETVICNLDPGTHAVRLEALDANGTFSVRNVQVNNQSSDTVFNIG